MDLIQINEFSDAGVKIILADKYALSIIVTTLN